MHLFLTGFMGSGKSTVGRTLMRETGYPLFDTDEMIVKKDGREISRIFKESGEGYFRRLETMILNELRSMEPMIVSCGGGMAIRQENVDIMKEIGKIVYLRATPDTILARVQRSNKRPLLEGNKNIEFITELMSKRIPYYDRAADVVQDVDSLTPEEISVKLKEYLTS